MPVIPIENEGQRLDQRSPVEGINVADAGRGARMMGAVGSGLNQLGEGLIDYGAAQKAEKAARVKNNAEVQKELLRTEALNRREYAIRKADADGGNIRTLFNESDGSGLGFDDKYKTVIDSIADPDVKAMVEADALKIKNNINEELSNTGTAMLVASGTLNYQRALDQAGVYAFQNPNDSAGISKMQYRANEMGAGFVNKATQQKLFMQNMKDTAQRRVDGLVYKNDYDGARKLIIENVGGAFGADKFDENIKAIDTAENTFKERKIRDFDRNEKIAKQKLEDAQDKTASNLYARILGGDLGVEDEFPKLVAAGAIRPDQFKTADTLVQKTSDIVSKATANNIMEQAYGGRNVRDLIDQSITLRTSPVPTLNQDDAYQVEAKLYGMIDAKKDKRFTDPGFRDAYNARKAIIVARYGGTMTGYEANFTNLPAETKQAAVKALADFGDLVYGGKDTSRKALDNHMNKVLKDRVGTVETSASVPAIAGLNTTERQNPQSIKAAAQNIYNKMRDGSMSRKDGLRELEKIDKLNGINQQSLDFRSGGTRNWSGEVE